MFRLVNSKVCLFYLVKLGGLVKLGFKWVDGSYLWDVIVMRGFPFEVLKKNLVSKNSIDGVEVTMPEPKRLKKNHCVTSHTLVDWHFHLLNLPNITNISRALLISIFLGSVPCIIILTPSAIYPATREELKRKSLIQILQFAGQCWVVCWFKYRWL